MKKFFSLLFLASLTGYLLSADNINLIIEVSKPLKGGTVLGTMAYTETEIETPFRKKVNELPINLWPEVNMPKPNNVSQVEWEKTLAEEKKKAGEIIQIKDYTLIGQVDRYVSWFGIVREIVIDQKTKQVELLIEHRYFDGLTDLHLQIVSIYGAGDFKTKIPSDKNSIPLLSLVRVYGKVLKSESGIPEIQPEYIRTWDWGLFTFMDYGLDKSNEKWRKLRKTKVEDTYSSRPDDKFYEDQLGKRPKNNK